MDNLRTADGSLAPVIFYYRTNTLQTSEKQTPLNSEQLTDTAWSAPDVP